MRTLLLASLVTLATAGCTRRQEPCERIFRDHIERYPLIKAPDLYKLAYQAAMGIQHMPTDTLSVRLYLESELRGLDPDSSQPLTEVIDPENRLIRVNLRPFIAYGGVSEKLVQATLRTAANYKPSVEKLERYLLCAVTASVWKKTTFPGDSLRVYIAKQREAGFPAPHHSETYTRAYAPAYRVVLSTLVDSLGVPERVR